MHKKDLAANKQAMSDAVYKALSEYKKYKNQIDNHKYIVAVNFREPSYRKRLYVYDIEQDKVIRKHHVSHGLKSSDPLNRAYAIRFSNTPESHQSSLGAMKTGKTYHGAHGYSLRLHGLEDRNCNVASRYIVVHPADYVTDNYILRNGRAGQSWGCLALDPAISEKVIDLIKNGTFVYVYY